MGLSHLYTKFIDRTTDICAIFAAIALLVACVISASNAFVRYVFSYSSNAFLEVQWYLFAYAVMLGAPQVLRLGGHVKVDVFYCNYSLKTKAIIDLVGLCLFLLPAMSLFAYLSITPFWFAYVHNEQSSNAGGLLRAPVWAVLPLGFFLMCLQGSAEIIKRIYVLKGIAAIKIP